jgi:hypothetical protein
MRPKIVLNTRGLVAAALTKLADEVGLDPLTWAGMPVVDFMALLARKRRV